MKIYFESTDGIRLAGVLNRPRTKTSTCIILCHGSPSNKDEGGAFTELAGSLARAGFAAFRFDFRGHGEAIALEQFKTKVTIPTDIKGLFKK